MNKEIVNITISDQTKPISSSNLKKILLVDGTAPVPFTLGSSLNDFSGLVAGSELERAVEAVFKQQKQEIAIMGVKVTDGDALVDEIKKVEAEGKEFFFIIPIGLELPELIKVAKYASVSDRMAFINPDMVTVQKSGSKMTATELVTALSTVTEEQIGVWVTPGESDTKIDRFASAIAGKQAPKTIGSTNWANQRLNGIGSKQFSATDEAVLFKAHINTMSRLTGDVVATRFGTQMDGSYTDVVHSKFWLKHRLMEALTLLFINSEKIPFTKEGKVLIQNEIEGVLSVAYANGILKEEDTEIFIPDPEDLLTNDRAGRTWKGIVIDGTVQGAVNNLDITFIIRA